jgi:hypothetical protein
VDAWWCLQEKDQPQSQTSSIVRTASQAEQERRIAAVQELHEEMGTQRRLDDELHRVQDELARMRSSLG